GRGRGGVVAAPLEPARPPDRGRPCGRREPKRRRRPRVGVPLAAGLIVAIWLGATAIADDRRPPGLRGVGLEQHLDAALPLDLPFRDESGAAVRLGDYFGRGPVILTLVYYECPMLCTEVLNGLVKSLAGVFFTVVADLTVVTGILVRPATPHCRGAKCASWRD